MTNKEKYNTVPVYSLKLVKERSVRYPVSKLSNSNLAAAAMQAYLGEKDCEHLAVLLLDGQNNHLGMATVSIVSIGQTFQAVRDVFKHAIAGRASAIILSHCHPSGDITPSREDIDFTNRAIEASKIIGIPIVDHIIVSSGIITGHYSFREHELIKG